MYNDFLGLTIPVPRHFLADSTTAARTAFRSIDELTGEIDHSLLPCAHSALLIRSKRRGWDSNPGYAHAYNGFRDRRFRPLSHLSDQKRRAGRTPQPAEPQCNKTRSDVKQIYFTSASGSTDTTTTSYHISKPDTNHSRLKPTLPHSDNENTGIFVSDTNSRLDRTPSKKKTALIASFAMGKNNSVTVYALKITVPYLIASGLWIIFSDRFLAGVAPDIESLTALQTYKGWFYISMSALLVYLIARRYLREIQQTSASLQHSQFAHSETQRVMATLHANLPGFAYRCSGDNNYTLHFVSDSCHTVTGYSRDELISGNTTLHRDIVLPEDRDAVRMSIDRAVSASTPYQIEYRIRHKDGSVRWIWEQGCGVFTPDGNLSGLEGYVNDISENKHLQEQLRASERLEHIGQAASTIIHDLKNPMQVILGHVELLRLERDKSDTERYLNTIENQVQTMLSMSRELLDYARGEITFVFTPTNVREMLQLLVDTYQPTFRQRGVALSFTWRQDPDISPSIELDRDRIARALMNLIGNAREALKDRGQIRIRALATQEAVKIEIQDNGPGIPEHIQNRLFEAFVTHGKSGGTGLGLAIARKIVESHHGDIACSSQPGAGTTFTITLPRTRASVSTRLLAATQAVSQ